MMKRLLPILLPLLMLASLCLAEEALTIPESQLAYEVSSSGACVTAYSGVSALLNSEEAKQVLAANGGALVVRVPDRLGGYPVTAIGEDAFRDNVREAGILLPDTVTTVEAGAFYGCSSLTKIDLSHVTTIGRSAFTGCVKLAQVTLSSSLTTIGDGAFMGTYALQDITIPGSVTSIGEQAFSYSGIKWARIEKGGPLSIDYSAFAVANGLTSVSLPDTVTDIREDAFEDCDGLTVILTKGSYAESFCARQGIAYGYGNDDLTEIVGYPSSEPEPTPTPVVTAAPQPTQPPEEDAEPSYATEEPTYHEPVPAVTQEPAGTRAPSGTDRPVSASAASADPATLPDPEEIDTASGQKPAIYSAPSTKALRSQSSKAVCRTDYGVSVYGAEGDWLMVRCSTDKGVARVGYVQRSGFREDVDAQSLSFAWTLASLSRDATLYEADDSFSATLGSLSMGTEVTYLATSGLWAYIETTVGKKTARGFVVRADLVLPSSGQEVTVTSVYANASLDDFPASAMVDGRTDTSWQFRVPSSGMGSVWAEFSFGQAVDLDHVIIHNGFWKTTNNKDQYTRNARPERVEITFRFAGASDFTSGLIVDMPDMKDWKTRGTGLCIDLGDFSGVVAVRLRPLSYRKGSKFPKDVCVSEVTFYSK